MKLHVPLNESNKAETWVAIATKVDFTLIFGPLIYLFVVSG